MAMYTIDMESTPKRVFLLSLYGNILQRAETLVKCASFSTFDLINREDKAEEYNKILGLSITLTQMVNAGRCRKYAILRLSYEELTAALQTDICFIKQMQNLYQELLQLTRCTNDVTARALDQALATNIEFDIRQDGIYEQLQKIYPDEF